MTTKQPRGHEVRKCRCCGDEIKVPFSDARAGLGKYCSTTCASQGRSHADAILEMLPATVYEIAEHIGVKPLDAIKTVKRMILKGLARPSGFKLAKRDSGMEYHTLVYSAGAAPSVAMAGDLKATLLHFQHKALLAAMPNTLPKLAEATGLHVNTVSRFIKAMRGAPDADGFYQAVFIRSWRRPHKGAHMPVYEKGRGKDAAIKFKKSTRKERHERQMAKLEKLGKMAEYRARDARRRQERREAQRRLLAVFERNELLNAFFGTPAERRAKDRRVKERRAGE